MFSDPAFDPYDPMYQESNDIRHNPYQPVDDGNGPVSPKQREWDNNEALLATVDDGTGDTDNETDAWKGIVGS